MPSLESNLDLTSPLSQAGDTGTKFIIGSQTSHIKHPPTAVDDATKPILARERPGGSASQRALLYHGTSHFLGDVLPQESPRSGIVRVDEVEVLLVHPSQVYGKMERLTDGKEDEVIIIDKKRKQGKKKRN